MRDKQAVITLLKELQETVEVRDVDGTIAILQNGRQSLSPDKNIQFVFVTVLNYYNITNEQLLSEKNDIVKYAKAFIIFYLRTDFNIEWAQIKKLMDLKNHSWLWQLMNLIKQLKPQFPSHAHYCSAKQYFDDTIKQYILKTTSNSENAKTIQ